MSIRSITKIFNITYYERSKLLYVRFHGCNFNCIFCINKKSIYDTHLPNYIIKILENQEIKFLNLKDFEKLIQEVLNVFDVDVVSLGGGEPTIDKNLINVVNILKKHNLKIRLLTNAYLLNEEYIKKLVHHGFDENDIIIVSIKAIDSIKHKLITGIENSTVLSNVKKIYGMGLNLIIETVYVPELLTVEDIVNLAKWISENLNSEISLIIDPYVPIPKQSFRTPTLKELDFLIKHVREYLGSAVCRQLSTEFSHGGYVLCRGIKVGFNSKLIGNIHLVHPELTISKV